ncbi:hypothetical protein ACFWXO_42035, partial [Kitasatospora sp. NPDC059088]|uniref:hypothetical protein n=1 Tax=Kitasatospora sp. NPDC059088 TaxID=3346722 RepID=UPI0036929671
SVTGRDDSGGYHVIKVDASPMTVDDIRGEVANWSSGMSIPDAFRRFTDFYTPESLRAAYPRDLTDFHRITEETSPDGRTKTIRIEHTHEQLAEQFAEVAIHHGGDGSVSIRWSTSEDTEPREPMVFNADNIGDVSGGLRSQKLTENPSFEMLDLPWDWFDYTAPMPEDIGQPLSAFGGGAKGWRIGEADMPQAERDALAHFPEQPGVFVVPVHTDEATGRPVWPNGPDGTLSAYQTAGVLARLRRAGIWNGTDTVQFVACNLGRGPGREFVDEVMLRLKELDLGPRALAATGPVYFAPRREGGPGHLVVASDIGFTESGHPVMVGGDHWLEFQAVRDGDSGQIHVQVEERGAHRAPDGSFHDHPEGYGLVESIAPEHRNPQAVKYAEPTPEQAAAAVALSVDHLTAAPPDSPLRTFMGQIKNGVFTNLRNPEGRLFQREGTVTFDRMMGNLRTFYNHAERLRPPEGHPGAEGTVLLYRAVRMEPQTRQQESFTDVLPSSTTYDRAFAQGWMSNPDRYALFEIQVPLSHPMLALSFPPGHAAAHGHLDEVNTTQYEVTLGPSRLTVTGREEDGPFHVIRAEAEPMTLHDVQETIAGWVNETPVREVFDLFAVFYSEQALRAAFPENLRADFRVTERLSADGREKTVEITSTHPKLTGQNATVHLRLKEGENGNETLLLRTHNTEDAGWGDPPLEFQYTRETLHEVVNDLRAGTLDKIAPFDTINLPSGFLWTDPVPEAGEVGAPLSAFGGPGNGWWLGHPEPSAAERYALARFPAQDGVFTLAVHTDPDTGLPLPLGTDPETGEPVELTEDRLVGILAGLHQGGVWNGTDRLQLVSCNLGRAPGLEYTTEVMRQLGLADLGSSALVATGPVYFTPRVDGTDGPGHLVVASAVGFTADGHPAVVAGGHFLEVERPTAEGQAPVIVDRGAHLPAPVYPDRDRDRPEGYDSAAPGTLHPDREPEGALAFANKKKTTKTAPPETTKTAPPETTESAPPETTESAPPETTNSAERIADVLSGGQRSAEAQEVAKQPEGTVAKGKERADEPKPVPAAEPDPDSVAAATVVLKDSLLQQLFTGTDKSLTYAVISLALKGDKSWETAAAVTNGHDESINDSRSLQAADRWAKENGLPTQRYDAEVKGLAKAFQQMKEWGFEQVPHPSGKPPEKAVSRQPGAGLPAQPEGVLTVLSSRGTCASCKSVVKDFQEAFPGVGAYVGYTIAAGQKSTLSNQPRTYHRGGKDVEGVIEYGWNDVARLNSTSAYVPKGKDIAFRYFPAKNDEAAWARRLEERAAEQEAAARRAAEEAARAAEANATSVVDQGIKPAPARQVTEFAKTYKGKPEDFVKELDKVMKKGIMAWKPSAEVQAALLLWYQKDPRPDLKGSTA